MINTFSSVQETSDCSQSTETEESDEDGTGNTGKPKHRCWLNETNPRNSDELAVYFTAAHQIETLFEAELLTTDFSKGRGGCEGL